MLALQLDSLGLTWVAQGKPEKALPIYLESLEASDLVGNHNPASVIGLALCASSMGESRRAVVLHSAAIALGESSRERSIFYQLQLNAIRCGFANCSVLWSSKRPAKKGLSSRSTKSLWA